MAKNKPRIAVDAMGGDFAPDAIVAGAVLAVRQKKAQVILVGDRGQIETSLAKTGYKGSMLEIVHASQIAGMGEKPAETLRNKKDSSILVACNLVRDGHADGIVSAGNSGTTLMCSVFSIGRVEGIERPGLATLIPTEKKPFVLIDVGANVDCKPVHLLHFGIMADIIARAMLGVQSPRVGLLSIGEERGKGNILVKETFEKLSNSSLNFVGNVEGRDLFTGEIDVAVCDGFVGNVTLKVCEGLASSMGRLLRGELKRGFFSQIGTMLALGGIKRFARLMDYAEFGGAPLLGLNKIVIICHGASNPKAISSAVDVAANYVEYGATDILLKGLEENHNKITDSSDGEEQKQLIEPDVRPAEPHTN